VILLNNENDFKIYDKKIIILFYSHEDFILKILSSKYKNNHDVVAVDITHFKSFIKRFDLKSTPTLIFFKNGKERKRITNVILINEFEF